MATTTVSIPCPPLSPSRISSSPTSTHLSTPFPLSTSLPTFPIAIAISRNSIIPDTVYDLANSSQPTRCQTTKYILFLQEVARITTLCELAAGTVHQGQQAQRTTLEWLLHQFASPDHDCPPMGECEVSHRISRHEDVLRDRLRSVGLRLNVSHGGCVKGGQHDGEEDKNSGAIFVYIRPYRTLHSVFNVSDSAFGLLRGCATVALPIGQELTAINVARGLSIYQYMEGFFVRHKALGTSQMDQVVTLWNDICSLYAPLLGQTVETLKRSRGRPQSMGAVMHRYFELCKAPGVVEALVALLKAGQGNVHEE